MLLDLQRAALSEILRSNPPNRLFTLALVYDRRTFESLPAEIQKELLNTKGVDKKLYVGPSQLNLPTDEQLQKKADGSTAIAGAAKKGTSDPVSV